MAPEARDRRRERTVVFTVVFAAFMSKLDAFVVNISLPAIAADLIQFVGFKPIVAVINRIMRQHPDMTKELLGGLDVAAVAEGMNAIGVPVTGHLTVDQTAVAPKAADDPVTIDTTPPLAPMIATSRALLGSPRAAEPAASPPLRSRPPLSKTLVAR